MNPETLTQLRDIRGLDTIPWWPPAVGWWLAALLGVVLLVALLALLRNLRRFPRGSWHRNAWKQLRQLRARAYHMSPQQLAGELSELLRRIAMARLGRARTAGLSGECWLNWLQAHDPGGFAWTDHGHLLLSLPYAPPDSEQGDIKPLLPLIDAAIAWVDNDAGGQHA